MSRTPPPQGYPPQQGYPQQLGYPQQPGYPPQQQPPPGFGGMPPYGYPPGYGFPGGPKRSNGMAVASLIFGLLSCLVIPSFLAVLFGWIGLRKTRDPQVGGKGLAIAGLLLGVLGIAFWGLASIGGVALYTHTQPARDATAQLLKDLSVGGSLANAVADAPAMDADRLLALQTRVQPFGPYKDLTMFSRNYANDNGVEQVTMVGMAQFAQSHGVTAVCVKYQGKWSVKTLTIQ